MASDTRRLRVVVTGDSSAAQEALEQVGHSARRSESHVSGWGSKFKAVAGFVAKAALTAGTLATSLFSFGAIQKGLQRLTTIEDATTALKVTLGDATKAAQFMDKILGVVRGTPFNLDQFATAAKNLVVFGVAADKVPKYLHAIGEAAAASGAGAEAVDSMVNAFGDAATVGRITGDTIARLAGQGVPALKILANHYGLSAEAMQKMVSKGMVPAAEGMEILTKGIEKGSKGIAGNTVKLGGSMEALRQTFRGALGGMEAAIARFGASILSPFMGLFTKGMTSAADGMDKTGAQIKAALQGVADSPFFQKIIDKILQLPAVAGKAAADFIAGIRGLGKLDGFSGTINDLGLAIRALVLAFKDGDVTSDGMVGTFERLGVALRKGYDVFKDLIGILQQVGGVTADVIRWFNDNRDIAYALAGAVGVLTAVTAAHEAVLALSGRSLSTWFRQTKLVVAATKVWTAVQWALNAAQLANPLGVVIGILLALAGVIYLLWTRNEKFRQIVLAVWAAIRSAIGATISWFKDTLFPALQTAVEKVGAVFSVVWQAILSVVRVVVDFFMSYVWPVYRTIFEGIGLALKLLYNVVWKPIWILIQIAAKIAIFYFKEVAWPILKWVFGLVKDAVSALYAKWKKNWDSVMFVVRVFVDYFKVTWWPKINAVYQLFKSGALILWQQVTKHWNNIKAAASSVGKGIVDGFNTMRSGVEKAWNAIKKAAAVPINFVIETVYDKGIMPLWNKVAKAFGIDTRLDYIAPVKFAYGGVLPGYAPRQDTVPAMLSPGEGILVPEAVRQLGAGRILEWNRMARSGKPLHFADGGIVGWGKSLLNKGKDIIQGIASPVVNKLIDGLMVFVHKIPGSGLGSLLRGGAGKLLDALRNLVSKKDKDVTGGLGGGSVMGWQRQWDILRSKFPGLQLMSAFRPGAITVTGNRSYHSMGRAVDISPRMDVFNWIRAVFGKNTKELIFSPAGNRQVWNGRPHMYTGAVRDTHWDHVHWAMDQGGKVPPGWFMGYNGLGRPEKLVNSDSLPTIEKVEININGAGDPQAVARAVRDELVKLGRRNGGNTQLKPA